MLWTGDELIVFGGWTADAYLGTGSRFSPRTHRWRTLPTEGAPAPRAWHSAVWTGTEMLVWGGDDADGERGDGAAYDPTRDRWRPIARAGAPAARGSHLVVWTGTEMIIWAGVTDENSFASGGRYDPVADTWRPIDCPVEQMLPRTTPAVWTGKEMVVWGGINGGYVLEHGTAYDPATDAWRALATEGAPSARVEHAVVWTGSEILVWGGRPWSGASDARPDAARYSPALDRWSPIKTPASVPARAEMGFCWTGRELCVVGGRTEGGGAVGSAGALFDPATNRWRVFSGPDGASIRACAADVARLVVLGTRPGSGTIDAWTAEWPAETSSKELRPSGEARSEEP